MRYVLISDLEPGMLVARSFYNKNLAALLNEGVAIKNNHIQALERIGVRGIYIHDEFSKDIELTPIIDDKSKLVFAHEVDEMLENVSNSLPTNEVSLKSIIRKLIRQITENNHAVVNMLELKQFDNYTFQHSINVCILAIVVGLNLDFSEETLENLAMAAVYHDIGKLMIDPAIINKPGELTAEEFDVIKLHPELGADFLNDKGILNFYTELGILHHHERYDGTGYPKGLKGNDINIFGRIIALVDVFDAITTKRVYKDAYLPSEAIEYIFANANRHFDMKIMKVFLNKIAAYPVGVTVELNNGLKGVVAETFEEFTTRPKIKIIQDTYKKEPYYIDLRKPDYTNIVISKVAK